MKRIKILLSVFISVLFCFALAGCGYREGEYVKNSLSSELKVYEFLSGTQISADYSFDVTTPDRVKYEVSYTVTVYYRNAESISEQKSETVSPSSETTRTVRKYDYFDCPAENVREGNLRLEITDVTVTPQVQSDEYRSYAIGFGTAGGAVLIACTVLFIVLKAKEKK